jgi:UDP-glucuronate decarboxylase
MLMKAKVILFVVVICTITHVLVGLEQKLPPRNKTVLVTGGAGFLGSHLCEKLLNRGDFVVCLDVLITGSKDNIAEFYANPNFLFIKQDVCELNLPEFNFDEIYNLACAASPPKYQMKPIHTLKTNFLGTMNLLELAKKHQAKFFQASTSEVYGDPNEHPQTEEYWGNVNPIGIRACYDEGKRIAETLCFEYNRQHQVPIKVVRIFNTYGPKMSPDDGRVISNFIIQALNGDPITIYGNGSQTRSFCYVDDLIDGFIKIMETGDHLIGPINLGNPQELSVLELALDIIDRTRSKSEIQFYPLPKDDPCKRKPDITLAKEKLLWEPKVSIERGLEETIKYFSMLMIPTCQSPSGG